ncbi:hypothetical protein AB0L22_09260 [Micromonospora haikouensis]|uniref:hypothetical protein n=1 Tax=Micromonospora haikouensis TaxID=686309 RepID=UPI00342A824E
MTGNFTPVERVLIAHACEDYAGNWYGPQPGGMHYSRYDCNRYVTEGHLKNLHDPYRGRHKMAHVWDAVKAYLDAHPEILAAGRLADAQRAERQAARDARAKALLAEAEVPFAEGRWDDALALVDRAELESPRCVRFDGYRDVIARKRCSP